MPNLSFGFYGRPSLSYNVTRNPFSALPPNQIFLTRGEVNQATQEEGLPQWDLLAPNQQKMLAGMILANRPDPVSQAQAGQVLINNQAYQNFTIIPGPGGS
jgi:hypothetical protein